MSDTTVTITPTKVNRRDQRPERIDLGDGEEAVRNDLIAKEQGATERTINRDGQGCAVCVFRRREISADPRLQGVPHLQDQGAGATGQA